MSQDEQRQYTFTYDQVLRAVKGWCFDCGMPAPVYIVHREVWVAAWPPDNPCSERRKQVLRKIATKLFPDRPRSPDSGLAKVHLHLCFNCLEKRLGRPLEITDFPITTRQDLPRTENVGIFLGYMLGKRAARRQAVAQKPDENRDKKDEGG